MSNTESMIEKLIDDLIADTNADLVPWVEACGASARLNSGDSQHIATWRGEKVWTSYWYASAQRNALSFGDDELFLRTSKPVDKAVSAAMERKTCLAHAAIVRRLTGRVHAAANRNAPDMDMLLEKLKLADLTAFLLASELRYLRIIRGLPVGSTEGLVLEFQEAAMRIAKLKDGKD